ncbi:glycosyl hydrolase family 28 protein [Chitinophaga sancti]|uniref:glycoside hydrolase family 28 protein n=1 Tax=Chitinophaga sancti TaxID=1004 RepID=UPI002A7595E1|nr:glycosyl hydrolase family 28 protein [Chitinophaga sancti]WPQ61121.1 glycosyl hydrolase family 28 protein [Chitinophaga sancti]
MKRTVTLLLAFLSLKALAQKEFPITRFGAKSSMNFDNANAIQRAIDSATLKGGTVIIPAGMYLTSPLQLKNNVTLHLNKDAILFGSTERMHYSGPALIVCIGQQNVGITGEGMIDGQGRELVENTIQCLREGKIVDEEWLKKRPTEKNRPNLLYFENCTGVRIKGVTLKNSACWVQNYKECTHVVIDGINVESTAYWNNDGVDIVDSKDVVIKNSYFNAADDAICLKSENGARSCEDVTVENCTLRSSANGFKLGTGSLGGFKNIVVKNITVFDTYRSAIALEAVDGGFIENVHVIDVRALNTGNALFIRLGKRNKDDRYSTVNNIVIEKVKAEIPAGKPDIGYPQEGPLPKMPVQYVLPMVIAGLPGHPLKNVQLIDVEVIYPGEHVKGPINEVPENAAGYPEFTMFGDLPAWGIYVMHADSIQMWNFKVDVQRGDSRSALMFKDVKALLMRHVKVPEKEEINTSHNEAKTLSF